MFREDKKTGLPKKLARIEQQQRTKDEEAKESMEKKRRAKSQRGKGTGGKPKPRPARIKKQTLHPAPDGHPQHQISRHDLPNAR